MTTAESSYQVNRPGWPDATAYFSHQEGIEPQTAKMRLNLLSLAATLSGLPISALPFRGEPSNGYIYVLPDPTNVSWRPANGLSIYSVEEVDSYQWVNEQSTRQGTVGQLILFSKNDSLRLDGKLTKMVPGVGSVGGFILQGLAVSHEFKRTRDAETTKYRQSTAGGQTYAWVSIEISLDQGSLKVGALIYTDMEADT